MFAYQPYTDHGVQAAYHQVYAPSAIAMPAPVMQPETIKVRLLIFLYQLTCFRNQEKLKLERLLQKKGRSIIPSYPNKKLVGFQSGFNKWKALAI